MSSIYTEYARRADTAGDYTELEPRFAELVTLPEDSPARARLREQIITTALPLAEHIAMKFAHRGEPSEDLIQVAMVGLVQAVDRFDPGVGSSFLGFAVPTVMGEVRRHFRDRTWSVRVPRATKELQQRLGATIETLSSRLQRMPTAREIAAELDVEVTEVTQALLARNGYRSESIDSLRGGDDDGAGPSPLDTLAAPDPGYRLLEDAITIGPLLAELPDRDRQVLTLRFGDGLTQSEIAARIGVSQMQVSRILTRVLAGLRERALAEPETVTAA
ncbi:SigB/SigF/SigG family RNA polymerase sigma factor [Nocardia sp. NPDC050697]|uniref:SigB/SigF/SigG family RNA polymerase sigma factor n=1 Tax=Nocardia sp. NPDC050697 TaxID=3155158 RepID=UPI0033F68028